MRAFLVVGLTAVAAYSPYLSIQSMQLHRAIGLGPRSVPVVAMNEYEKYMKSRKEAPSATPPVDPAAVEEITSFLAEDATSQTKHEGDETAPGAVESVIGAAKAFELEKKAASAFTAMKNFNEEYQPLSKAKEAMESAKKFDEEHDVLLNARAIMEMGFDGLRAMTDKAKKLEIKKPVTDTAVDVTAAEEKPPSALKQESSKSKKLDEKSKTKKISKRLKFFG